jgi:O-antigen/teichoic acid export membrane protein
VTTQRRGVPGTEVARATGPGHRRPKPGRPDQTGPPGQPGRTDRTGLAEVARGGVLNLGGAGFSAIATLVVTILVTRHFSRSVAGAFFAATSLFLIVETISNLGAFNGAIYFIARLRSLHKEARIPAIMRAAIRPVAVCSAVAAVATVVFAVPLARLLLGGHASHGADPAAVARILRALAVTLPFAALADTFLGASRGYRDMLPTVLVDRIGRSSLQLAGVATAILLGDGALLAPLWALPYVPACIVSWLWLRRIRRRDALTVVAAPPPAALADKPTDLIEDRPGHDVVAAGAREFWRFTGPRALASAAQILIQRLDIVLVGIIRGPAEAAVYTAATRFLVVGQLANVAIGMAAQPQFTHLFAIRDRIAANTVYQVTTSWLVVLTWPLYLLTVIYGPAVLAVFGHSYRVGGPVMVILGLSMLVNSACGQVDVVLTTTGRTTWSLANGLLAVIVNVSVDLVLIPRYGIIGAAIGWAAAIGVANLVPLAQVATVIRVHPFGRGSLAACLLSLLSFGAIPLAARAIAGDRAPATAAAVAAGCLVMLAGLWLGRNVLQLPLLPGAAKARGRSDSAAGPRRTRSAGTHSKS